MFWINCFLHNIWMPMFFLIKKFGVFQYHFFFIGIQNFHISSWLYRKSFLYKNQRLFYAYVLIPKLTELWFKFPQYHFISITICEKISQEESVIDSGMDSAYMWEEMSLIQIWILLTCEKRCHWFRYGFCLPVDEDVIDSDMDSAYMWKEISLIQIWILFMSLIQIWTLLTCEKRSSEESVIDTAMDSVSGFCSFLYPGFSIPVN